MIEVYQNLNGVYNGQVTLGMLYMDASVMAQYDTSMATSKPEKTVVF